MSTRASSFKRYAQDHFEPETSDDPHAQRKLRGQLEQIDFTAFASNREVVAHVLGHTDVARFQHLAVAAANARAQWVAEALTLSERSHVLSAEEVDRLARMRSAYEELTEAYEGLRRMVERGYLTYQGGAG